MAMMTQSPATQPPRIRTQPHDPVVVRVDWAEATCSVGVLHLWIQYPCSVFLGVDEAFWHTVQFTVPT